MNDLLRPPVLHCVLLALVACALPATGVAAAERAAGPNIVYILCDDLGYGDVQCLNPQHGKIPTPHIDQLASQGMIFTDAHSGSSVCSPTRYGVLTGRYAWRTPLQKGVLGGEGRPLIAPDRLTVGEFLQQQGYHTACLGKWHLDFLVDREAAGVDPEKRGFAHLPPGTPILEGPTTRGFDYFLGFTTAAHMNALFENDHLLAQIRPVEMLPRLSERACQYVAERAKSDGPFFLYLPLNSPHTPIVPAEQFVGKTDAGRYGDFVLQTDWVVGQVLAALDEHQLADDTLVIFTSDNGCSPAAFRQLKDKQHRPSAEMRGYKADIWDGGHRVPFIVRWPGKIEPGSSSAQLICLTDLLATCAELFEQALPDAAAEDSVSILPALLGEDEGPLREAVVHHSIEGDFAIRQGDWKLALCAGSGGWGKPSDAEALRQGKPPVQLYHLGQDFGEKNNVQADYPEIVDRLTSLLEQYVADGRSTPGAAQENAVPVRINKGAKRPR